jgi:hypothetical protein
MYGMYGMYVWYSLNAYKNNEKEYIFFKFHLCKHIFDIISFDIENIGILPCCVI